MAASMTKMPNLDCMTLDDLYAASRVFRKLADYARIKREAMRNRLEGNIDRAVRLEADCEFIYTNLPPWARW